MGLIHADITLGNARKLELRKIEVKALVDTGSLHLCIPPHVVTQLELDELERREVTIADGSPRIVPHVGPVLMTGNGKAGIAGGVVMGAEMILGRIPCSVLEMDARCG
jgi:clan AA aspartic protease